MKLAAIIVLLIMISLPMIYTVTIGIFVGRREANSNAESTPLPQKKLNKYKKLMISALILYFLLLIGSVFFFPTGMIAGWILFDPVMRCKVIRKVSRRNYGIINFVGDGTKVVQKIKNFEHSLIWRDNELWVLSGDKIIQVTKDANAVTKEKQIKSENVLTYVDTVPVVYVDMHSMEPLSFSIEKVT